ncbi:hypothetical protein QVD17_06558 [Tagetes erecta]|uniref:Secreted protein n=1 Tax=Tagetes erecta TaxID=13708 RepID=A0AAD8LLX6_TARER|nr:hypothetical protein QVD17_06558 [Tagetes erecta]
MSTSFNYRCLVLLFFRRCLQMSSTDCRYFPAKKQTTPWIYIKTDCNGIDAHPITPKNLAHHYAGALSSKNGLGRFLENASSPLSSLLLLHSISDFSFGND